MRALPNGGHEYLAEPQARVEHDTPNRPRRKSQGLADVVERERRVVPPQYPAHGHATLSVARESEEAPHRVDEHRSPQCPFTEEVFRV